MFSQSTQQATSEQFEALAETLADFLISNGDHSGANQVLSVVSRQANTPSLALRRAEHHLVNQDPASALAALIPVWEAGFEDPEVESLMGTISLILGLDDVVDNLTARASNRPQLAILRWVLSCCDSGISAQLNLSDPNVQWTILRLCRTFADQNRTDIVGAIWDCLVSEGSESLLGRISAIPRTPWILATPARPRLDLRDSICEDALMPAIGAAYNWVWASAREVFRGERVLLVGFDVSRFAPLFEHADLHVAEVGSEDTLEELLQTYPSGAFDHIMCVYGFECSVSPRDISRLLWRNLRHGGQLHMVSGTHHQAVLFDAYVKPARVLALLETMGFEMKGDQLRDLQGVPVQDERGRVMVLRAQKNLV